MKTKFEIFFDEQEDEYSFHFYASNDEILLSSEGYDDKENCIKGIQSIKKYAKNLASYEKKIAKNGKFFFHIKGKDKNIIATSQMYSSEQNREKGILLVQTEIAKAETIDLTTEAI